MQFFNIGFGEIIFILILATIVLGPERIVSYSRWAGKFVRQVIQSPFWKEIRKTQTELRQLPNQLMQESGLKEDIEGIKSEFQEISGSLKPDLGKLDSSEDDDIAQKNNE